MNSDSLLLRCLDRAASLLGYSRSRAAPPPRLGDVAAEDSALIESVSEFSITSLERRYHLVSAVRYVLRNQIPGAFVECGVWRGGSMMLMAKLLQSAGHTDRELYLYDTFEGMPPPSPDDVDFKGASAQARLDADLAGKESSVVWAVASLPEVRHNLQSTGYPADCTHFVQGKVEDTIPATIPDQISLLRLDTDWYESTKHELEHLYHLVAPGGVVIIDDYGYWKGARKAVDEFIEKCPDPVLLHRIDDTGRAFVKIPASTLK